MHIPQHCDVVVIGGGPSGSTIGSLLSQKGYKVVLFDKQKHPRYQVGESLIPDFWKYCDAIGVTNKVIAEGFIQKAGGMVNWKDKVRFHSFKDFDYSRPALHVERDRFDHILLEHCREQGAQIFEEVAVLNADFDQDNQVIVNYRSVIDKTSGKISCRFVVDASGQNAVIGKQLGIRVIDDAFRYMSVWGYFYGSKYLDFEGNAHPFEEAGTVPPTTFVSSLDETGDSGWAWHIILREKASVGLVLPLEMMKSVKAPGESWEEYFIRKCYDIPVINRLLKDAQFCEGSVRVIRDYSYRSTQLTGPGFFLVGDAAGFVDPIFSVGLVLSMYSAYAAAWAIDKSFQDPTSVAENQEMFSRQLQGRLEIARSLALPRYQSANNQVGDLAKTAIQLERASVQELMHVVSSLTTRSENFLEMVDGADTQKIGPGKLKIVEQLNLD